MPSLFALIDDQEQPVRRIPLSAPLSRELSRFFDDQKRDFLDENEAIEFDGGYNVDQGEILFIPDYPLPEAIINGITNPLNLEILDLNEDECDIKALFTGDQENGDIQISFQGFDKRKLLKTGFTLIGSRENYTKLESPGLVLQDKLTTHYDNGTLYFHSYHNTKRFLDLSIYYQEATDAELDVFAGNDLFCFEEEATFKTNADSIVRKKIALLQRNNVLDDLEGPQIRNVARALNRDLPEEHHIDIELDDQDRIVIPADKKKLKELVRFLDEDYVTAPLTKRRCLTNSKKYLSQ